MDPVIVENVVRIVFYGPPFKQSDYEKASPYQLAYNKEAYLLAHGPSDDSVWYMPSDLLFPTRE